MDGFGQLTQFDFAHGAAIRACFLIERGDAMAFEAIQPSANGAPSELILALILRIRKAACRNILDALTNRITGRVIDGGQHAQTQFSGWFLGFLHRCIFERTGTRRWQSGIEMGTDKNGCGANVRIAAIKKWRAEDEKSARRRAIEQNRRLP